MKRIVSTLIIMVAFVFLLAGCKSRNKLISGTYIHNADDDFCEVIIVHDGNDVSVKIDGKEYDAKMEQENEILVNGQYEILETSIKNISFCFTVIKLNCLWHGYWKR